MSTNPFLFLAPLNGTLAFNDRAGGGTATGSGAVRYQAAPGARTNLFTNPSFETNISSLNAVNCTLSRPTGGTSGSYCARITATANGAFASVHIGGKGLLQAGVTVRVAYDARLVSGSSAYHRIAWYHKRADSAAIGGITIQNLVTLTTDWQRFETTFLLTAVGTHGVILYFYGDGAVSDQVFDLDSIVVEVDAGAGLHYFDGSTGGAWLDPITGILGTAHASPSVSQAVAWVEEGTTNGVKNPRAETTLTDGLTNWTTRLGATVARVTTYAYIGSASIQAITSNVSGDEGIASGNATGVNTVVVGTAYMLSCYARGSGTVRLKAQEFNNAAYNGAEFTGSSVVLNDTWQRLTLSFTPGVALTDNVRIILSTVAQSSVTFYATCFQLEAKTYATSYADGAIGTGYAWAGTAHASSSTRTACSISVDETNRIKPSAGAVALRINRTTTPFTASKHLFTAGSDASGTGFAGKDVLIIGLTVTSAFRPYNSWIINDGAEQAAVDTAAAPVVGTWADVYSQWNGTTFGVAQGVAALITGTRTTPQGDMDGVGNMTIGHGIQSAGSYPNVLIGPVAIFDRPLTANERARLLAADELSWDMLNSAIGAVIDGSPVPGILKLGQGVIR